MSRLQTAMSTSPKHRFHPIVLLGLLVLSMLLRAFQGGEFASLPFLDTLGERTVEYDDNRNRPLLDFFVAGFAKCGTTSLLSLFANLPETEMAPQEVCAPFAANLTNAKGLQLLTDAAVNMETGKKRGIKCPAGIRTVSAIERMTAFAPAAKWIIGVRHPVKMFASYYNYRISELHNRNESLADIPLIESLTGLQKQWKGVSTDITRYEWFLMQLGKTNMTTEDLGKYTNNTWKALRVVPNNIRLFLYTMEQLDEDPEDLQSVEMSRKFRLTLQEYLGLKSSIPTVPRTNVNFREVHPESIQICDDQYDSLREGLVRHAAVTVDWILNEFLASPDVVVANREHFAEILSTWKKDPCLQQ